MSRKQKGMYVVKAQEGIHRDNWYYLTQSKKGVCYEFLGKDVVSTDRSNVGGGGKRITRNFDDGTSEDWLMLQITKVMAAATLMK